MDHILNDTLDYSNFLFSANIFLMKYSESDTMIFDELETISINENDRMDFTVLCTIRGGDRSAKSIELRLETIDEDNDYVYLVIHKILLNPELRLETTTHTNSGSRYHHILPGKQKIRVNCKNVPTQGSGQYFIGAYLLDDTGCEELVDACSFVVN